VVVIGDGQVTFTVVDKDLYDSSHLKVYALQDLD